MNKEQEISNYDRIAVLQYSTFLVPCSIFLTGNLKKNPDAYRIRNNYIYKIILHCC